METLLHLDTNVLIDLVTVGSPNLDPIRRWLKEGKQFAVSAIVWSEFCNGPHTGEQKDAVYAVLGRRIADFGVRDAEWASRLFHYTGRRRGSHADCMIAAVAMNAGVPLATRNVDDFQRFVPYGLLLRPLPTQNRAHRSA